MTIGPGTRVGPYEVTALVGEGGMGKVWRARHTALHRDDALKVLPEVFATDHDRLARFEREAQVLASFNHPNIAHVYGLEQSDDARALVMELVEGPTLADRLLHGPIPVAEALAIARQIADALEAAHDKAVIHRDLKPANVKVRPDGAVKVLDFGLAKALDPVAGQAPLLSQSPTITSPAVTGQGVILGTAAYMSPEQASGGHVDHRSDIWSFGCVLYEMLTGKAAFSGDSVARVLAKVLEREPDLAALPASTPSRIRRLIRRCLEKDPRRRLHHVADARVEIDDANTEEAFASTPATTTPRRRSSVVALTIGALIVGFAAAWAARWYIDSRSRETGPVVRSTLATLTDVDAGLINFRGLAISRDGQHVAYSAGGRIYVRSLNDIESQPVRGAEDAVWPAFSPDGTSLAFFVPSQSVIKRITRAGGRATVIANTDGGPPQGLSWGPDDTIVFATTTSGGLWRVRAAGGEAERLTTLDTKDGIAHSWPSVLPNGRAVLFAVFRGASWRIAMVSLETRQVTVLVPLGGSPRFVSTGHIVYFEGGGLRAVTFDPSRLVVTSSQPIRLAGDVETGAGGRAHFDIAENGSLVYAAPGGPGQSTLVWVDSQGTEQPLDLPMRAYDTVRVSPDGTRIAADILDEGRTPEIWVSDLNRPGWTRIATPQQDGGDWFPKWTPDGRRLVFAIFGARAPGLFWAPADGTGTAEPLLTIDDSPFIDARGWTPDGRSLLFTYGNPAAPVIGVLSMQTANGGRPAWKPLVERSGGALAGPLSPDGDWIVTESFDATGVSTLYIERFPDLRDRQRVSAEGGGRNAVLSRDGRELYYRRPSDGAMMAVSLQTKPSLSIGTPTVLFRDQGYSRIVESRSWDLSPDDRFLMIKEGSSPAVSESRPIVLVQNWINELRRAVSTD